MEHKFKRVFAFLLSMLMLINSVPVNAFATETHDHSDVAAVSETDTHTHSLTLVEAKDASCTEDGNIAYYYCECGKYFFDQDAAAEITADSVVIAAAHSWDEGVETVAATETAEGVMTYTCSACQQTRTEAIPMLTHTHSLTKAEDGEYWVCSGCGKKYADEAGTTEYVEPVEAHVHSMTATEAKAATCTEAGNSAYWYCSGCGKYYADEAGAAEIEADSWVIAAKHSLTETAAVEGTCAEAGNIAYWTCSECGKYFSDAEGENEIGEGEWATTGSHDLTAMEAVDASCTISGTAAYWFCSVCGQRFADAEGSEAIDYVAHEEHAFSGYTWDFSEGSASSTDKENTLSLVKTKVSNVTDMAGLLVDDTLESSTGNSTMQLSTPVVLSREEDWTVELVAKGNGTDAIRSFMSTNVALSGIYAFIGAEGDLSLVKKISYTADNGTAVSNGYTYYKVSNEDFDASILATDAFDITQYHVYQLRCTDGVISYWLDGEKIGDLALYEQNSNRTSTSKPEYNSTTEDLFGLDSLTLTHVGCGSSSNASSQGLQATVKYLGFYPGHSWDNACDTDCNNEGCTETRETEHAWDEGSVTTAPTATTDGVRTYTCGSCGATTTEVIPATGCEHSLTATEAKAATCTEAGNTAYWTCSVCGKVFADELGTEEFGENGWVISVLDHTLTETPAVASTCTVQGNSAYWTCSECSNYFSDAEGKTEIEENSWVLETSDHSYEDVAVDATCTAHGETGKVCSVCGDQQITYSAGLSGDSWDFTKSAQSKNGLTLKLSEGIKKGTVDTPRPNGTWSTEDGVLTGETVSLEMSGGITLSAENDWVIEAILKTDSDSTSPKTLVGESGLFSEGTSVYLTNTGNLLMAQKGTVDGTNTYWYFMVDQEVLKANLPDDYDITKYHNYQLRCTDGAFSYWLDGEKIGDLSLTASGMGGTGTTYEGAKLDYSSITVKYIGNGNTSSFTTFGFSGDMKYLGIYPGHSYTNACDTTCDNEGCTETREIEHAWNEGEVTTTPTEWVEGVKTYTCSVCQTAKTESIPATVYTWTFDDGTAKSTNGLREWNYVTTHNNGNSVTQTNTMSISDGVMSTSKAVALEMEDGIRVTSDKNWAFEITMKTDAAGTAPKNILAESKGISEGTMINLSVDGRLRLMANGVIEGVDDYWYYSVANETFDANMPSDFDMSEYHTYRLECNDGVFSYVLDGNKIGDLTTYYSLNSKGGPFTGNCLDHSDLTFRYMGNGTNKNVLGWAFSGIVDSMSLYTDVPDHVHAAEKVEAKASTCTEAGNNEYWICSCGIYKDEACTEATTVEAETLALADHTPAEAVRENEAAATCYAEGSYEEVVYCSVEACKAEISRETKTIEKTDHTPAEAVRENEAAATCYAEGSYEEVVYCSVEACKAEISRETKTIEKINHTPAEAVRENEVAATCYAEGSYEEVVYCSVEACKAEISRETKSIEKIDHTPAEAVRENEAAATCYAEGSYEEVVYCSVEACKTELSRETKTIGKIDHTPAEAVRENEAAATCYAEGSYEEVVYCSVEACKTELSRETKTIGKIDHTPAEAVRENEVAATCYAEGSYEEVVYCSVGACNAEISRATKTIEKTDHTPAEAVRENEVAATCQAAGSYDEVIYCSIEKCGAEISRTEMPIEKLEHAYSEPTFEWAEDNTCKATYSCSVGGESVTVDCNMSSESADATCTTPGTVTFTASVKIGDQTYTDEKTVYGTARGHSYGEAVFVWAEDGKSAEATVTCTVCDENTEGHSLSGSANTVQSGTTEGTCQTVGTITYLATITLGGKDYSETKTVDGDYGTHNTIKTEAVEATCTEAGNNAYWSCSVENCGKYFSDAEAKSEIQENSWIIAAHGLTAVEAKAGTCTEAGNSAYQYCNDTACGKYYDAEGNEIEKDSWIIAAHGLTAVEAKDATCTEAGNSAYQYCNDTACGKYYDAEGNEIAKDSWIIAAHGLTHVEAKAATCTEDGNTEYWSCEVCEKYYSDAEAKTEITDKTSVVVPASHKLTHVEAVAANCTEDGNIEYWSCEVCEKFYSDAEAKTEITDKTSVAVPASHKLAHVEAVAANCTKDGNIEYWSCEVCEKFYSDAEAKTEITDKTSVVVPAAHTLVKVEAKEATCAAVGNVEHWHCSVCEKNFADETAAEELETVEIAVLEDHIWDFSQNSVTSNSGNTLSFYSSYADSTQDTGIVLEDGVWAASRTVAQMSESITVNSANNWTMEIVAAGTGSAIRSVFSTSATYGDASFIYIDAAGDLSLAKKGAYIPDGATAEIAAAYTYYKVSDADFETNMPADFDSTQYHTYQLRCEDGVFSYWLDGEKIGNLALSENSTSRGGSKDYTAGNGTPFDFSNMSMNFVGNGATSKNSQYGLTANVKSLGIYIYPGHSYTNACDTTCDQEGCTHTRVTSHAWNDGEVTTPPTSSAEGVMTYTCTVCGETKTEVIPAYGEITMKYDDRLAVSELGQTDEPVITTETVTSQKVGTDTQDDAVLTYVDGKLIATGVGTAMVTWGTGSDALSYHITVEPATISMIMVTGHSLGSGSQGDATQSIICEEGQVYSTNERAYAFKLCTGSSSEGTVEGIDVTGMGIGYGSELRPTKIDALNESGDGVNGADSAIGYRWAQLTGEKVWVLNSAKGSTSLSTWQEGGYNYRHAVELFTTAEEILYNEVQAGHYKVNKLGIVNYTTANGDQTWAMDKYTAAFNSMWEGFQQEMAIYDFDGDGTTDTVDCIGLLPLWNVCSMNNWDSMNKEPLAFITSAGTNYYGKLINYSMSAYEDKGVIMASNVGRSWTTDADVAAYFAEHPIENMYGTLQSGATHTSPTTLQNGVYGDGVHYAQLGYNVQGIETAESMYEYWYGMNDVESVTLLQANGVDEVPAEIEIPAGSVYGIIPDAAPTSAKLSYELTGDVVSYSGCLLTAGEAVGTAALTIKDQDGNTLKTVNITVREATDEDFEDVVWYEWDFANGSAANTNGITTDNTLTLVKTSIDGVTAVEDLLVDGTLAVSATTTMKLGSSVKLDSSKDWAVELVAAGDGTNAIRTFLSTGVSMSASKYFYIDGNGDLSIVNKAAFTADDGTSVAAGYTYYKVSDADFAANMPADFDITQYHSYQLRCENGVFSYWLDGKKIGDLALSEQTVTRGDSAAEYTQGSGTPFDFSVMTMKYVGTGSNSNSASQGLTATVKELNLYADSGKLNLMVNLDAIEAIDPMMVFPGDVITLSAPDTGDYCAKFVGWAENQDGTGTMYEAGDSYTVTGFAPVSLYAIWDASETTDGVHSFVNGICTNCGSADKNYAAGHVWTFENGEPTSEDGLYTFSYVTTHGNGNALTNNGTMTIADGVMSLTKTALEMNDSIRLTSDKTWVFDITMKTDATKGKNLLAENKKISVGTSIHLSASGSLGLMKHGTLEGREAADYWIYQVSSADFKANMPADFDITEYHTYQLRCEDGVFSYWLDGKKIGDLSITKNINSPYVTHNGAQFDYSDISLKYMSNGVSGNVLFYGVAGDIEQMRVFTSVSETQHLHGVAGIAAAEATCTENGNSAYWACGSCGKYFADAEGTAEIEKDSWVIAAKGHSMTATEAKTVTCTEAGNSAYWTCSVCEKYFSDAEGKTEIEKDSWIIAATGHSLTKTEAVDVTCTEAGNSAYWTCGSCGKYFSDAAGGTEIEKDSWIIAATGHSLTKTEAVEVTCQADGNSAYWTCDTCGMYFADAEAANQIEKDSWIIEKLAHNYSEPTFDWAEDNSCTASYTCSVGNETETVDCDVAYETSDATCTEAGTVVYTASVVVSGKTYTDSKTVEGEPLGHQYGEAEFVWAEDGNAATAFVTCSVCQEGTDGHVLSGEAAVEQTGTTAGDCENNSTITYQASITLHGKSSTDTKTVNGALGSHSLTETTAKDATCTEQGSGAYWTCSICGKFFADEKGESEIGENSWIIAAKGHSLTETTAKDATCTEQGNSAYWTCSACGKFFADEKGESEIEENSWIIAAKGHSLSKVEAVDATCVAEGNGEYWICGDCEKLFSDAEGTTELEAVEKIPALSDHIWDFASGNAVSDAGNTLTKRVAAKADGTDRPNGTVEFTDGVLRGSTITMEMSETIQLNADQGWFLEATLKAKTDSSGSTVAPRVLLAENDMFSVGTSVYLGGEGNLLLAQKGTVKDKNAYWYFMVSDADFDANMPEDYDATQEHTYRLECVNGTFTYWLDGKRIGDLSVTSNSMGRSGTEYDGQYLDYSSITAKFIGSGNSSSLKTFGFSGDLKKLSVYSGHSFTDSCDVSCNNEGCTHVREAYHLWGEGTVITEPTETTEGEQKLTCTACGETKTEIIPALGHIHDMVKTEGVEAGCLTGGSIDYWTCSKCGKFYADEAGETELEQDGWITEAAGHTWNDGEITKEATATEEGVRTYTCTVCGETKTEAIPVTIYLWNFEDGTATSTNSLSTLSLVTTLNNGNAATNGTMEIVDGVMNVGTSTLELSSGVELSVENDWAVEFTMKAHTDSNGSVISPRTILAEDKQYSNGTSFYLTGNGNLVLMQKGTMEEVTDYLHFKVSNADFKANMPADFDMKEYHTYRMECNDGVFSYWLDGSKIGDLTVTEAANKNVTNSGQYLDYSKINAKFIGNGSSSNVKNYGLTGDVEEICIYTSAHTHALTKTEAVEATCEEAGSSAYWTCESCSRYYGDAEGKLVIVKNSWIIDATGHSFTNDCDTTCDNSNCDHTREITHAWDDGTVTTAPTENETGIKTFTCTVCGETKTEEVPAVGHTHMMTKTEAKEATCTEAGSIAYWTCSVCGKHYAEETGANELAENEWLTETKAHTLTKVEATEATCVIAGDAEHWVCSVCQKLFSDENGTTEIEAPESTGVIADHIWDFSKGSAVSDNGNTLTFFSSSGGDTEIVLKNGTLVAGQTIMQMSEPVTLDASNDWTVEIVAKGNGTDGIRTVFSTESAFATGSFIYINTEGDMSIGKKGTFTAADGTVFGNNYTYYKVSNEDYSNSILADGSFDITQYHTYQLRCEDGVFSTWVDGEKIGNLSMSEQTASRSSTNNEYTDGTGTPFDFTTMAMNFVGNGTVAGKATYGLTGTVKELAIYPGHRYTDSCDTTCDNEGCDHVREANHTWDIGEITKAPTEDTEGERKYTCIVCGETKTEVIPELGKIVMKYDDRMRIADIGQKGEPTITTKSVTSKKVGTETLDEAVITYADGKLIATGVGVADVVWGTGDQAITYTITVEPATISMIMVTGHSLGSGSQGDATQTIVCEEGQVYSTNERAYAFKLCTGSTSAGTVEGIDVTGMGLGYSSELRPTKLDALNESGDGVNGADSAIGYRWAQLTGEKVWVLNSAKGSTSLSTWQEGGYNYRHAVELFTTAEEILYNEVQAGHYKVNKLGILNYTTANGDQSWAADKYTTAFNSMWEGFQREMAIYDFDGDGTTDTVDCIGLLPLWNVCSMNNWDNMIAEPLAFYRGSTTYYGKLVNYYMSLFGDDGVILASSEVRNWTTDADVTAYFKEHPIEEMYGKLQNGSTHSSPTTVRNGVYGDGVHYGQLGYNVQGIEAAESLYEYWYGLNDVTSIKLLQANGVSEVPEEIQVRVGEEYVIAPETAPSSAKLTYSMTGRAAAYNNCIVTGVSIGNSILTIKDQDGNDLKTVNITVLPAAEEEYEEVVWYSWDFANGSATNTTGSSTDNTLTLVKSADSAVSSVEDLLKDGTLAATSATTMQMSKSVTLDSANNWAVELVAKSDGSGIRSFLSTDVTLGGTYFYINENGDLSIATKGSFRADDGTSIASGYTYYKVSDEDYSNSILDSGSFDITEYHSYQLRCSNGVFSFWLDGEKIGDLTMSEQSTVRGDSAKEYTKNNGTPFDFNTLTMTHVGCGSVANPASQGLNATVKQLNIYSNSGRLNLEVGLDALSPIAPMFAFPGESVVLPKPHNGQYCANFLGWADNQEGTGTLLAAGTSYTLTSFEPTTLYGIWQAFETSDGVHTYVDGVCTSCGCADGSYYPWDIWDFENGTAIADDDVNTIGRITTNYMGSAVTNNGTMTVSGGVMHVDTAALEMSESITLTSDKDWAFDFTMKAYEDADGEIITPKTLLAESKLFSEGTSFYLTATGDMLMAQKGTVGSTNTYWYFKVSNADFAANMPAKFDITQYHTYRVMCSDGTFSYWLDGEKIGDFALTSNTMSRGGITHTGQKLDYSSINVRYIGNGNTGNCKTFGFTGDVERIGIYTESGYITYDAQQDQAAAIAVQQIYPGEEITLAKPDTGEYCVKFTGWTKTQDGSGTVYAAESSYQVSGMETFTLYGNWEERTDSTSHTYGNKGVITYPTCAAEGYTTYTCTYCGHEKYTDQVGKSAHDFSAEIADEEFLCDDPTYDTAATYYRSCTVCGLSSKGTGGESTFESGRPGDGYYSVVSKQNWDTAPGISESEIILNNSTGERRQAVHVMQVDISDPYASILPSYMGMNPTPGNFQLGTMSEQAGWVEENMGLNVVGAMNTCLSWYNTAYYDENPDRKNEPLGILVIDGTLYCENTSAKTCLVVNYDEKDGVARPADIPKVELRYTSEGVTGWEEQVVSCNFDFIVKDGKNVNKVSHVNQSSKSVLGIKADGTIVIMQNDGEQAPYSNGMSIYEIGETMLALGCVDAVRCDGGGTSTYLSQRPGEELAVTCSPADGAERPTTSGILVISSAPATGEFMRASISTEDTYYAPGSTVTFDVVGTDLVGTKVDIPANAVWQIKEEGMGTIQNGVFVSNGTAGKVTVQMVYNDRIVGEHSIEIVIPETFQFRQSVITVPYGKTVDLALTATINNGLNTVVLNPDDIAFTTDNEALGTFDGLTFTAVTEENAPEIQVSEVTATMKSTGLTAVAELNLGKASVVIDDFEDGISDWNMYRITSRESIDFDFVAANSENGYVYNGEGALGMVMHNETHMQQAGYYAQLALAHKWGVTLENATSVGAWIYVPDDFYNLWIRMSFYTQDENGSYSKRNIVNAVEGGEVYTTIEESGWHYFSCDISGYENVRIKDAFIEILSQHCSANALYQTTGSPHGMSAIYVDDVIVDYSEAADDREAPIFDSVTLVAGGTETALKKREMVTTDYSVVTVKAAVSENMGKTNATGLDGKSAKAYVDGIPVTAGYADGTVYVQDIALADGAHRVKFEISDNAGNTAVAIRVINVASGVAASTIEVVPAEPTLDRLYGGSVYWMDLNATMIETIQEVSFDIDLNATNHWELDHMELAEGFTSTYTVDAKTNTATITITRTGESALSGKQTLASLPIRVVYFDTDIALEGYTAQTFWTDYNFWPQDVAVDVDRGVIRYVDGYSGNVLNTFSSREYSIDTEMYTSGQHMDPDYKAERGTAHVHDAKALSNMAPTCTEDGYIDRTYCEICESVVVWGTKQPATGHKYAEKNGTVSCENCGELLNGVWNGKTYIDGTLAEGWVDSTYYYVNGEKVTGHYVIGTRMFTFDENGVYDPTYSYTDFHETADGKLMYFANNEAVTGYQYLGGKAYYFDENGYGLDGEYVMAGETCLFEKGQYVSCSTADIVSAGMIGPDATYVLYSNGTLKLDGTGDTYDFANHGTRPFSGAEWQITRLEVGKEITSIGDNLLMNSFVSEVVFEEGSELRRIGKRAFMQCYKLTEIELPDKVTTVDAEAFSRSTNLKKVVLPVSVCSIDPSAFHEWKDLTLYVGEGSYSMNYAYVNQIPYVTDKVDVESLNGIVWLDGQLYYYKDGSPYYAGLIEVDGYYYYANSSGKIVTGEYYVNKNNGLMESGTYTFDENGRMIIPKNGFVEENGELYYYENDQKVYAGLIMIESDYYYVNKDGKVITGDYYVEKTNGLMEQGVYTFGEDGKMILSSDSIPMFRMYDPNSGEHFYTGSELERDFLVEAGWHYEGVGFNFPEEGKPVYRLYEPVYGEHLYTMDMAEVDKLVGWGWNNEGVAFNSAGTNEVPQYRLHNPNVKRGGYHFTGSEEERDLLISFGWIDEGIGWYSCLE